MSLSIQLLTNIEGLLISEYSSDLCNGTSSGTASTIQARIQRRGNIITLWASDPYATDDGDFMHRNDIHLDCPIVINLDLYKLSYTYRNNSGVLTTVIKDFSDSNNPPTGYESAHVTSIKAIFDKLKTSAKRGYEVCSNPGSIFRNVSLDELILDVTPGEDKVYKFDGNDWLLLNTTPQALFENGSRTAWNRITDKLFYNNGIEIYRISTSPEKEIEEIKNKIETLSEPVGTIKMYAGSTAPEGWLLCLGQMIPTEGSATTTIRSGYEDYKNLFDLIGGTYGVKTESSDSAIDVKGNSVSGFGVFIPNLQLRFPLGAKNDSLWLCGSATPYNTTLGQTGGVKEVALTESEMPRHTHVYQEYWTTTHVTTGTVLAVSAENNQNDNTGHTNYTGGTATTEAPSNGTPHDNIPPYLAINFIIKY